jgi:hypothetical protein
VVYYTESEMAAYLGFRHTSELRKFAISWVCLAANKYFSPAAANVSKRGPITLLSDDVARREIEEVQGSPLIAWSYQEGDREHQKIQKWKIIAWCLLKMAADIKQYNEGSDEMNDEMTRKEQEDFRVRHQDMFSKGLTFPNATVGFPKPLIGPFEDRGETELEVYNRCWETMRYLNYGFYDDYWLRRFQTVDVVNRGKYINESNCVYWMRGLIPGILPAKVQSVGAQPAEVPSAEAQYLQFQSPEIELQPESRVECPQAQHQSQSQVEYPEVQYLVEYPEVENLVQPQALYSEAVSQCQSQAANPEVESDYQSQVGYSGVECQSRLQVQSEVQFQFEVQSLNTQPQEIQGNSEILYWRRGKPYIPVKLFWIFAEPYHGSHPIDRTLQRAEKYNIPIPPAEQVMPWDPRACKGGAHFRAGIRYLLSCKALGLHIQRLEFHYYSEEEKLWVIKDALRVSWGEMSGDFMNLENSAFFVRAVLEPFDMGE